jgi:hypothetical protein
MRATMAESTIQLSGNSYGESHRKVCLFMAAPVCRRTPDNCAGAAKYLTKF